MILDLSRVGVNPRGSPLEAPSMPAADHDREIVAAADLEPEESHAPVPVDVEQWRRVRRTLPRQTRTIRQSDDEQPVASDRPAPLSDPGGRWTIRSDGMVRVAAGTRCCRQMVALSICITLS